MWIIMLRVLSVSFRSFLSGFGKSFGSNRILIGNMDIAKKIPPVLNSKAQRAYFVNSRRKSSNFFYMRWWDNWLVEMHVVKHGFTRHTRWAQWGARWSSSASPSWRGPAGSSGCPAAPLSPALQRFIRLLETYRIREFFAAERENYA